MCQEVNVSYMMFTKMLPVKNYCHCSFGQCGIKRTFIKLKDLRKEKNDILYYIL